MKFQLNNEQPANYFEFWHVIHKAERNIFCSYWRPSTECTAQPAQAGNQITKSLREADL